MRVQKPGGVKAGFDVRHECQFSRGVHEGHIGAFFDTDAMLTGNAAAQLHAEGRDALSGQSHPGDQIGVLWVTDQD